MRNREFLFWAVLGVGTFHLGVLAPVVAGPAMLAFLFCIHRLVRAPSRRWSFYGGVVVGFLMYAPQLYFFWGIFGPAAVPLWLIMALWLALFLMLARVALNIWPRWGTLLVPFLWLGCEYFRSELYPLRFAWLTPGFALNNVPWRAWLFAGTYGFSFLVLLVFACLAMTRHRKLVTAFALALAIVSLFVSERPSASPAGGPVVAGLQFEEEINESRILAMLDDLLQRYPDTELVVLPEYAFVGEVPASIRAWTDEHDLYLVAGGKDLLPDGSDFYNTAYVIGPDGSEVFRQVKSVPIPFFDDGLPAPRQKLWDSPWGKIGIAVCYDMNYSRVMDPLVLSGAEALIIPTFDAISWGEHQHTMHARVTQIRAREYGIPVFRVVSSGFSQLVTADGREQVRGQFPGQGSSLSGRLPMDGAGDLPVDRFLWPIGVGTVCGVLLLWLVFGITPVFKS